MAKLFTIELCYLATITYHVYQLQTDPALYAGAGSFPHTSQLQASTSVTDRLACAPNWQTVLHLLIKQCVYHSLPWTARAYREAWLRVHSLKSGYTYC